MTICSRKNCSNIGSHKLDKSRYYCDKHYRFLRMRNSAQQRNKYIPSIKELENLLDALNKMECPICNKQMIWHQKYGYRKDVISLQHNHNGNILFICNLCNIIHGNSKLKDKYFNLKPNEKYCPKCEKILDKKLFHKVYKKQNIFQPYCKLCQNNIRKNKYQAKRIEKRNICAYCNNELSNGSIYYCNRHLEKHRDYSKQRYRRIKNETFSRITHIQ